ncbi:hypothetical protein PWG15_33475 (plasmid) [Ensifer adhaerens]|uniref:hypothetical protein n=1 Tax=Ensifer adhaerens TaxID=106592 RepID=UPI0023A9D49F|nr:hypothetical protein [Ensifer adhaerens]WDZ81821.1 hypothetical protein PWG15_33475 [Ensifer adhaerens]
MSIYFAAVFTDLVRHSAVWNKVARDTVTHVITEYRYLSRSLASQYGGMKISPVTVICICLSLRMWPSISG